jgi:hypothetical protein
VAHRQGVIHRDLKPANILLDPDGNAYLADFGIAKDLQAPDSGVQTVPGTLLGSPAYTTPEQIREEPVSPQTDIYSLGLIVYEILAGIYPFRGTTPLELLQAHLHEALPRLALHRPDLPSSLDAVLARATAKQPADRYADVATLVADFRRALSGRTPALSVPAIEGLEDLAPPAPSPLVGPRDLAEPINPYKGLRAFQEPDAADFFGREALVTRLLARLAEPSAQHRFLAVVGPSGSGKSSVVRAGLVPAIRRGELPQSDRWFVLSIIPGAHPLEELEAALLRVAVNPPPTLLEQLQDDERGLLRAVKRILPDDPATELVLVIDQFEEIFTLVPDEATRTHFLNSLIVAVTDPRTRLRVVVTLRADFYDRPLLYPALGDLIRERTEVVLPLSVEELERAIINPARRVGVGLEPELVATIIRDVGEQPGALPLLQYALTELFERRTGAILTRTAYVSSGGVLGALARRAEEIYQGLNAEEQALTRQVFLRLVTLGEGVEDTRRRVRRSELAALSGAPEALEQLLETFQHYRLLTFDHDPVTRGATVEVAHEALLRTWERLREWLATSRAALQIQRQLGVAAAEWARAGQDPSYLASGARQAQFEGLVGEGDLALTVEEQAYVQASVAERER